LSDSIAQVEKQIAGQNAWVDRQQGASHVSIVYLSPMTVTPADSLTPDELRHQLEGAYVAVFNANHPSGDANRDDMQRPLIRLLLDNSGSLGLEWQTAVQDIEQRRAAPDDVVAVAGLGHSIDSTRQAIDRLSADGIPMFGAVITADDFSDIRGLVRVAPTNSREAQAALEFMSLTLQPKRVLLVYDRNAGDLYSKSLAAQFTSAVTGKSFQVLVPEPFDSSLPGVDNGFRSITANVCLKAPDVIYFAGRSRELQSFIVALGQRACPQLHLGLLTGDDASGLDAVPLASSLRSGIDVYYTNLAHPDDWKLHPSATSTKFAELFDRFFHGDTLTDADAIMAHDAVLTAVTAIRSAAGPSQIPSPGAIIQVQLTGLNGENSVLGASGLISIDAHGDPAAEDGANRPVPKTVVILRLTATGSPVFVGRSPA
jgi:ABC-type branched-subunit amino acid transport system substrate-binding protein